MAIPTVITDLSATIASNSPAGGDQAFPNIDDYLRAAYGFIRQGDTKASDIASAGTVDLGAAVGRIVDVTGTTTITSFGTVAAGIWRIVRFTGALTVTHNATSLILPGGASIVTAAGDCLVAVSLGSGNWVVTQYQRASGYPVTPTLASGTWTPTVTSVANVASSTAYVCLYSRVGNTVTVSGVVDIDPTSADIATTFDLSLPVASAFTLITDASGVINTSSASRGGVCFANATDDRLRFSITPQLSVSISLYFSAQYIVK